jgi:hypothetical protein
MRGRLAFAASKEYCSRPAYPPQKDRFLDPLFAFVQPVRGGYSRCNAKTLLHVPHGFSRYRTRFAKGNGGGDAVDDCLPGWRNHFVTMGLCRFGPACSLFLSGSIYPDPVCARLLHRGWGDIRLARSRCTPHGLLYCRYGCFRLARTGSLFVGCSHVWPEARDLVYRRQHRRDLNCAKR